MFWKFRNLVLGFCYLDGGYPPSAGYPPDIRHPDSKIRAFDVVIFPNYIKPTLSGVEFIMIVIHKVKNINQLWISRTICPNRQGDHQYYQQASYVVHFKPNGWHYKRWFGAYIKKKLPSMDKHTVFYEWSSQLDQIFFCCSFISRSERSLDA